MDNRGISLPDWLGSGEDLFATIQIIQGKDVKHGFLEIDYNFKFSEEFNYPVVFTIKTVGACLEADGIAFRIGELEPSKRKIDEHFVAPSVSRMLTHEDFINFLAEVVREDISFAIYLKGSHPRFRDLKFYPLAAKQKIVFNERLGFEIMERIDRQKAASPLI
jgi:hypothetical protein